MKRRNPHARHLHTKAAKVIPDLRHKKRSKAERRRDAERQERDRD